MAAESLLARCGHRAIDQLEKAIDGVTNSDEQRRRSCAAQRHATGGAHEHLADGRWPLPGLMTYPFFRLTRRPVLSILSGTFVGICTSFGTALGSLGGVVREIAAQLRMGPG